MTPNAFIPESAAEAARLRRQHAGRRARTFRDLFWLRECFWPRIDQLNGSCGCFLGYRWNGRTRRVDPEKPAVVVMLPPGWRGQNPEVALGGPGLMLFAERTPWDGKPLWCWTDALVVRPQRQPASAGAEAAPWIERQPMTEGQLLSGQGIVGQFEGTVGWAWVEGRQRLALTAGHVAGRSGRTIFTLGKPRTSLGRVVRTLAEPAAETVEEYLGGAFAGICPQMKERGARFELDAALIELTAARLVPLGAVAGKSRLRLRWPASALTPLTALARLLDRPVAGVGARSGPQQGQVIGLSVQYQDPEDDPGQPPVFSDYLIKPAAGTDFGTTGDSGKLVYALNGKRPLGLYGGLGNYTAEFGPALERWRRANDLGRIFGALGNPGPE